MKRILVRADDLGYCEAVNYGIAKTVYEGIIQSVGVMTNMSAAEHGVELLERASVCYGQHTNICVGRPLTDPERIPSLCKENGEFKSSSMYRSAQEDFVVLDEVVLEIEAQYQRFLELIGRKPDYFEGHAVMSPNFYKGLEIVANRHDLPLLKSAFDGEPVRFKNTSLVAVMESMNPEYDPFASLQKVVLKEYNEEECGMFICHPGYLDAYLLRTSSLTFPRVLEVEMCCSSITKQWLSENHVCLVNYNDL